MIQIHTNNTIQSLDETHTKFVEQIQLLIQIKNLDEEQKRILLDYFENQKPHFYQMEVREGLRSLIVEFSYEKPFSFVKKEFSGIQTFGTTPDQQKDLKKISKMFQSEFNNFQSIREKQMVVKLYKMYNKKLKNGSIGRSKTDFKNFLNNILEN